MSNRSTSAPERPIRLGWISSWNSRCGIAEHSRFLLDHFDRTRFDITILASGTESLERPDEGQVIRPWTDGGGEVAPLLRQLDRMRLDILVIQYNFSLLSPTHLEAILELCQAIGTRVVTIFHSTDADDFATPIPQTLRLGASLSRISKVLVHTPTDADRLRVIGATGNVAVLDHGHLDLPAPDPLAARAALGIAPEARIIGSYGFLLPHKGIERLIESFALLRQRGPAKLLLINARYPSSVSDETEARCRQQIEALGLGADVLFETGFLSHAESLAYLAAADVIVYPYLHSRESSSAAVRMGIAADRPVICTPLEIFGDVAEAVHLCAGMTAPDIAESIDSLLADPARLARLATGRRHWRTRHAWPTVAGRLQELLQQAVNEGANMQDKDLVGAYVAALVAEREAVEANLRDMKWLHGRWLGLEADWWHDKNEWRAQRAAWAEERAQLLAAQELRVNALQQESEQRLQATAAHHAASLAAQQAEQTAQIRALEHQMQTQRADLERQLRDTQSQLDSVYASSSWRLTAAWRACGRLLRRS